MNYHQTPEDIIKAASPEQRILWNSIFLTYGTKIGLSQFYFMGLIAGSEFLTYSANKLYVCLQADFAHSGTVGGKSEIVLYNAANVGALNMQKNTILFNTTTGVPNYSGQIFTIKNLIFSRLLATSYSGLNFIGYRISI